MNFLNEVKGCDQNLVEHAIMEMIADKDFDGYLITRLDVAVIQEIPGSSIQTAALIYSNGRFFIRVVEKFFAGLTSPERVAVLKHEISHFVNRHCSRRNGRNPKIWNIACDMAINQGIINLPSGCIELPPDWDSRQAAEFYYEKLLKQTQKSQNKGNSEGRSQGGIPDQFDTVMDAPLDSSSDAESMVDDIIRETIKERINAGDSTSSMRGLHAGALSEYIEELTKPAIIDWRHALTRFISSRADEETRRSLKRPSRRELQPWGKKREYQPEIVVAIDTSGSVSDQMLADFFSQIRLLGNMLQDVNVVVADATVQDHFTFKPGMEERLRSAGKGRGGTDFDPAIKYINRKLSHCDGAVYLTDGWCLEPKTRCRVPMFWIVTENEEFEGRPRVMAKD